MHMSNSPFHCSIIVKLKSQNNAKHQSEAVATMRLQQKRIALLRRPTQVLRLNREESFFNHSGTGYPRLLKKSSFAQAKFFHNQKKMSAKRNKISQVKNAKLLQKFCIFPWHCVNNMLDKKQPKMFAEMSRAIANMSKYSILTQQPTLIITFVTVR